MIPDAAQTKCVLSNCCNLFFANRWPVNVTGGLLYTGITRANSRLSLVVPQTDLLWRAADVLSP